MAKAQWCKITPASGNAGETEISVSGDQFTGRTARSTQVTINAPGSTGTGTALLRVEQEPKPEFISIESPEDGGELSPAASQSGRLRIKTNSGKVTVKMQQRLGDDFGLLSPYLFWQYELDRVSVERADGGSASFVSISGETGASSVEVNCGNIGEETEFSFNIPYSVMPNPSSKTRYLIITASNEDDTVSNSVTLVQTGGSPQVSVNPDSVTLSEDGSAIPVTVDSEAPWTAS